MIHAIPHSLVSDMEHKWQAFCDAIDDVDRNFIVESGHSEAIRCIFALSDFVAKTCIRSPHVLLELLQSGDLFRAYPTDTYRNTVNAMIRDTADETTLGEALCKIRRREMIRIAWRDLLMLCSLAEILSDLSSFAEACLDESLAKLYTWHCATYGTPTSRKGTPQQLVVIGMGKLGAHELNFSSDIDLVFSYPAPGNTVGAPTPISNEEFFVRLSRQYIKTLSVTTIDGPLFRVDMKLRPYGENGPLVMSFDNMEDYYQYQGRDWERYAWVKAREVAGDRDAGRGLLELIRPFVYRRYIDYSMLDGIRQMKMKIERELKRKGIEEDIKLGPGGIREVEFFGQIFQLLRGGVVPKLQERSIIKTIDHLADESYITRGISDRLKEAYDFLRRTENRIQEHSDQQRHALPIDETDRSRLAAAMGCSDWTTFLSALNIHRAFVHSQFNDLLAPESTTVSEPSHDRTECIETELESIWFETSSTDDPAEILAKAGYDQPAEAVRLVSILREDTSTRSLSPDGRKRLDTLMPRLLKQVGQSAQPITALQQVLNLIKTIQRRTTYLSLLLENSGVLNRLIEFSIASPWLISYLSQHPLLLDEMLDPRTLYSPPSRQELRHDISRRLGDIDINDLEHQMDALRHFKQVNTLRVAAADISGAIPLMRVSDHLSDIAGEVVNKALDLAWNHLTLKHGLPTCELDGQRLEKGFAVIAYGKMGGFELGYDSDLDLVFLHAGTGKPTTSEQHAIDSTQFFSRLAQRAIHILTAHTPAGLLYETDTRLRPSGSGGLLVSHIEAFENYQLSDAWTWEHQAIVRARAIWGEQALQDRFEAIRKKVISQRRPASTLRAEVMDMRRRLRQEHGNKRPHHFHLKQDDGGMVDIEFIVQYIVLLMSHRYPDLLRWTDNVRLIQALAQTGLIHDQTAHLLRTAYLTYRSMAHRLSLQKKDPVVPQAVFESLQKSISTFWANVFA